MKENLWKSIAVKEVRFQRNSRFHSLFGERMAELNLHKIYFINL